MLKVNNLTKVFSLEKSIFSKERNSFKAVNEVCLNIKEGEIFSIVGESGSGKSVTMKSVIYPRLKTIQETCFKTLHLFDICSQLISRSAVT